MALRAVPVYLLKRLFTNYLYVRALDTNPDQYLVDYKIVFPPDHITVYYEKDNPRHTAYLSSSILSSQTISQDIRNYMNREEIHVPVHVRDLKNVYRFGVRKLISTGEIPKEGVNYYKSDTLSSFLRYRIYFKKKSNSENFFQLPTEAVIYCINETKEEQLRIIKEFNEGYFENNTYIVGKRKKNI